MMLFIQAVSRFGRRGRIPFSWLAAAVCLAFAAAGVAVVDDYGVGLDEETHRNTAISNVEYVMGDGDALPIRHERFYGLVIDLPLLLMERALGLQDRRDIYRMRHLLMHLFYIVGGLFCGLLVYRMFGSRWVALLGILLFLLHPRLYAHSFFNVKDVPFTAMFVIRLVSHAPGVSAGYGGGICVAGGSCGIGGESAAFRFVIAGGGAGDAGVGLVVRCQSVAAETHIGDRGRVCRGGFVGGVC